MRLVQFEVSIISIRLLEWPQEETNVEINQAASFEAAEIEYIEDEDDYNPLPLCQRTELCDNQLNNTDFTALDG